MIVVLLINGSVSKMVTKIGIDLGTTNLLMCLNNSGVIVDEPSIITVDASTKNVLRQV